MAENYKENYKHIYEDIEVISESEGIFCGKINDTNAKSFFVDSIDPYYKDEMSNTYRRSRAYYGISFSGRINFLRNSKLEPRDICLFWSCDNLYKLCRDFRYWHRYPIYESKIDTKGYHIRFVDKHDDLGLYELYLDDRYRQEDFNNRVVLMDKDFNVRNTPFASLKKNNEGTLNYEILYVPKNVKVVGTINKDGLIDSKATIVSIKDEPYNDEDKVIDLSMCPNYDPKNIDFAYLKQSIRTVLDSLEQRRQTLTRKNREELIAAGFKNEDGKNDINLYLPRKALKVSKELDDEGIMLVYKGQTDEFSQLTNVSLSYNNSFSVSFSKEENHSLSELFGNEFDKDMIVETEKNPRRSPNWLEQREIEIKKDKLKIVVWASLYEKEILESAHITLYGDYLQGEALHPSIVSEQYKLDIATLKGVLNMNLINPKEAEEKRREIRHSPKNYDDLPF